MEAKAPTHSRLYRMSETMMYLAYINILWFLFTVAGLVVFGFFPATAALFAVLRELEMKEDVKVFPFFWETFKKTFLKANLIGLIFVGVGYILYVDWMYIFYFEGGSNPLIFLTTCLLSILYIISFFFTFTMFVHYELTTFHYLKNTVLFTISQPAASLMVLLSIFVTLFAIWIVPGIIPFFSLSLVGLLTTKIAHHFFRKIEIAKINQELENGG